MRCYTARWCHVAFDKRLDIDDERPIGVLLTGRAGLTTVRYTLCLPARVLFLSLSVFYCVIYRRRATTFGRRAANNWSSAVTNAAVYICIVLGLVAPPSGVVSKCIFIRVARYCWSVALAAVQCIVLSRLSQVNSSYMCSRSRRRFGESFWSLVCV